jgi:mRNA-degrading endonuclease RelE of RelBE toxin-antitoxin system
MPDRGYEVFWSEEAAADLDDLRAVDRPKVRNVVGELLYQAETSTRNRRPLESPLDELPEATWEARLGDYRILHRIEDQRIVTVLRVIFKGRLTTGDAMERSRRR